MTSPLNQPDMAERLLAEVARIEAAALFGRSGRMFDLFQYLATRSAAGDPPKETEVTLDVFGRDHRADGQDGIARVYIHRLRRKLDNFYRENPGPDGCELSLPKGEYRFVMIQRTDAVAPDKVKTGPIRSSSFAAIWPWLVGILIVNLMVWAVVWSAWPKPNAAVKAAQTSELWSPLLTAKRPLLLVVGDYYLFGDYQGGMGGKRLVRDFSINTKSDLLDYLIQHPERASDYADVGLSYLPTSEAFALRSLVPLLPADQQVTLVPSSALTPNMMQYSNVLYIGLTGSLGKLQESTFSHARFTLGNGYDEVIDGLTKTHYFGVNPLSESGADHTDYALLSTYQGPTGNRIMVITGTRDAALSAIVNYLSVARSGDALGRQIRVKASYEALFEIKSRESLLGKPRLIGLSARDTGSLWTDGN